MKTYELSASKRTEFGKGAAKRMRYNRETPCAIYRSNDEPIFIKMSEIELDKALHNLDTFVYHIDIDGEVTKAILRDVEFHPVFDNPLHADFLAVEEGVPQTVEVPITLVGRPVGVESGGKLVQKLRKMKVKGDYTKIPDRIEVNVKELRLGHSIKISDLHYDNFMIRNKSDVAVASVEITRALRQAAAAEGIEVSRA